MLNLQIHLVLLPNHLDTLLPCSPSALVLPYLKVIENQGSA